MAVKRTYLIICLLCVSSSAICTKLIHQSQAFQVSAKPSSTHPSQPVLDARCSFCCLFACLVIFHFGWLEL
ncbi:hypothetical protein BKA61DRAFT_623067 [Leptodontidium sp. MPI-SDFR-AT-0119]|nr:hypothetical protein BKA61DRAFT_623067 [Leptodontidium sp. MPI-SDFR-AT-0119]